jgi:hypothetical protein
MAMKKALTIGSWVVLGMALGAQACITNMRIGTYAINNYAGNGSSSSKNMYQEINLADYFFTRSQSILPGYGPCPVIPLRDFPTRTDAAVTKAHIIDGGSGAGKREVADFVYYGGHGIAAIPSVTSGLFLGDGAGFGNVYPSSFSGTSSGPMGGLSSYKHNRWFMTQACALFPRPPHTSTPAAMWSPIFRGLKAMLGFESYVYDNSDGYALFGDFWNNWTWGGQSLFWAFYNAENNHGYSYIGGSGLHPGCLSGRNSPAKDYCNESFAGTDNSFANLANAGTYWSSPAGWTIYYP